MNPDYTDKSATEPGFLLPNFLKSATPCTHPGGLAGLIKAAEAENEALADEVAKLAVYRAGLRRRRENAARHPEMFSPPETETGDMDEEVAAQQLLEAEGMAELGLYADGWRLTEEMPLPHRESPAAVAVRLRVLTALRLYGEALALAEAITAKCPLPQREAAGRLFLAAAADRTVSAPDDARALITRLAIT